MPFEGGRKEESAGSGPAMPPGLRGEDFGKISLTTRLFEEKTARERTYQYDGNPDKAGPAWRRTELIGGTSTSNLAGLAAADFDWALSDTITLTQDVSALVQSGSSTFVSDTGLQASISDAVSVRLSYTVEHDTDPPAGAVKTDTLSRITVIYGF